MIEDIIKDYVKAEVIQQVAQAVAPMRQMPEKFANKITLSISDMCEILGVEDNKAGREAIRNACKRGELPFRSFGREYIFPRPMVEAYLFGEWKEREIVKTKPNVARLADKIR